ncbi:MAG: DUF3098 domain-containing protein [Taibaiella sp.]|nr:DUF3098 domain-containing protein [Taibaiella sp.]
MSTPNKQTPRPSLTATHATITNKPASAANKQEVTFLFDKENYKWMFIGLGLIFLAFFLMSGGKSANPNEFHYDEIYSFRRITLAPIVLMAGFAVEAYAIMRKPKTKDNNTEA